mmetsp:Transcript_28452/g.47256  ORF Transcript_28452/g.47256 Transcript_28452/m.47256 type:complete len:276 (+) Transcript_28452:1236-2063(+)
MSTQGNKCHTLGGEGLLEKLAEGNLTRLRNLLQSTQLRQRLDGGTRVAERVVSAQLLSKAVLNTSTLQYNTGGCTSNHTSTIAGRPQHNLGSTQATVNTMRNTGILHNWNLDQICLAVNHSLGHGAHYFLVGRTADPNLALAVTNNNSGSEFHLLTSFHHLGHTTDLHDLLLELLLVFAFPLAFALALALALSFSSSTLAFNSFTLALALAFATWGTVLHIGSLGFLSHGFISRGIQPGHLPSLGDSSIGGTHGIWQHRLWSGGTGLQRHVDCSN